MKRSPWSLPLLLCLVTAAPAFAAWPSDPNVNLPVCTEPDFDQEFPAILPDGAGGVFMAWQDYRSGTEYDLYAQRISASGAPLWGADGRVICNVVGDQLVPHLCTDGAGGVIVTWNDTRAGLSDIYCQRLTAGGDNLWAIGGVPLCTAPGPQHDETLIPDGAGGAIVTWFDRRADGGFAIIGDIYVQRINASGVVQWTADGMPVCTTGENQEYPQIVGVNGGALIVWTDSRSGSSTRDIYGQVVTSAGAVLGPANGFVVCNATGDQTSPVLATDGGGGAFVAWSDPRSAGNSKTYAQRVSNLGITQWAANGLPVGTGPSFELFPTIVSDGAGGAIVAWSDFRNYPTSGPDVYAQRISSAGAALWTSAGVALCTAADFQFYPVATTDGAGGAIVTWQDQRNGSANTDVYARRVTAAGAVQWGTPTGGAAVSTAPGGNQTFPMIATDNAGGAIVTWMDARSGSTDLYAQRILSDGTLGGGTTGVAPGGPAALELAPAGANPARDGRLRVRFTLATGGAGSLEVLDVAGRKLATTDLAGLGPGRHTLDLGAGRSVPPGLYLVRLREGGSERVTRVAVLH